MTQPVDTMIRTDATAGLRTLATASVGLIVTDPAYDTLEHWREQGTTSRLTNSKSSSNAWFPVVDKGYFEDFLVECYRVLQSPGHIYILCDDEMSYHLRPMIEAAGFTYRKKLIWHKVGREEDIVCPNCGEHVSSRRRPGRPGMGYPYRSCYEVILLAQKGKRPMPEDRTVRDVLKFYYEGDPDFEHFEFYEDFVDNLPDVMDWPRAGFIGVGDNIYPTQKPLGLLEKLISQSSNPGDLVLDPFAGSGSTLLAARNLGRHYLGFDITEGAIAWFNAVLENKPPPKLTGDGQFEEPEPEESVLDFFT